MQAAKIIIHLIAYVTWALFNPMKKQMHTKNRSKNKRKFNSYKVSDFEHSWSKHSRGKD